MGSENRELWGLDLGKVRLGFGRKFWSGIGVSALIVIAAIYTNHDGSGWIIGLSSIAGSIVGILFAPSPRAPDRSPTAMSAVERLMDMGIDLVSARTTIVDVVGEQGDGITTIRLMGTHDTLLRQEERLHRTVSDWDEISPGVADKVRDRMDQGRRRFIELTQREEH